MDFDKKLLQLSDIYGKWWDKGFSVPEMTKELYPYTELFTPIRINSVAIKNRVVMAPMGNISMCDETGRPNMKMLKYFEERARGGVGLITTGLVPVSFGIDKSLIEKDGLSYFPRIDRSRTVFAPWRDLASMCHAYGAKIFIQLTAGLGRVGNPQCITNQFNFPCSSSFNPSWYMSSVPCLPLSDFSLNKIIRNMGQTAADAKACNLDGVYLHGHEGYLLEQMSNPAFNRRILGKYSDYEKFGLEMVKEIRTRVGEDYPIMYRIDLSLMLNETYKERMNQIPSLKKFKNGRKISETLTYMKHLVEAGVDVFDVDLGCYDNWWLPHPPSSMPSGCFLSVSALTKKAFSDLEIKSNKGLPVPIVAVGKLGYPDVAESALRNKDCDMIMLGRPLLADPDWCNKAYSGKVETIIPCIGCQEACLNEFVEGGHPQCAVNPRTAFEDEYSRNIEKAEKPKKIAVIGGGPAGIIAADTLIKRGHFVDLYESGKLGGSLVCGSKPMIKYELKNYLTYLLKKADELKKNERFDYFKATAVAENLKAKSYDVIITATGAKEVKPDINGIDNENVFMAADVLKKPQLIKNAENIVVVGGGAVGVETAYFLKFEHSKNVKIIEMSKYIMKGAPTPNRCHLIHYLHESDVEILNCAEVKSIEGNKIIVRQNTHKSVPDPYVTWAPLLPENIKNPLDKFKKEGEISEQKILSADAVVIAVGVKEQNTLFYECQKIRAANEVYNIGDSFAPARVFDAVRTAYRLSRNI